MLTGVPRDIGLQLVNGRTLSGNDPIDQVADRYDPDDFSAVHHRQMPDAMLGHQPQAFLDRVRGADLDQMAGQNVFYGCLFRGFALEDDLPGIISFGNDTHQLFVLDNEKRADIFVGHHLDRIKDSYVRSDGPDLVPFVSQDFADGVIRIHC